MSLDLESQEEGKKSENYLEQVAKLYAQDAFLEIINLLEPLLPKIEYKLGLELARAYINAATHNMLNSDEGYANANALLDKFSLEGKDDAHYLFYKGYVLFKLGLINDASLRFERALRFSKVGEDEALFNNIRKLYDLCCSYSDNLQDTTLQEADLAILDQHFIKHFGKYQILFKSDRYEILNFAPNNERKFTYTQ